MWFEAEGITAFYGDFQALFGIDFALEAGETVAIIGANGAGKSTFLKVLAGIHPATSGRIVMEGRELTRVPGHQRVRSGIALVPEGRRLFPSLTVEENLLTGSFSGRSGFWTLELIYEILRPLSALRHRPASVLSGGEQQMVAIGRALMSNPRLLLCDEISLGLAPAVVRELYRMLAEVKGAADLTLVVVEQDTGLALKVADRFYCFREGHVSLTARPQQVTSNEVAAAYFGV